ncbi:MAG: dephospho-CoA kinase [Hydrococcus sp. RU_2_2]|nr:dephospho-CoA kinase [Hydrococcus sp. RU_2_2]NJP21790.1 dephospho-CoA kinase [Hydrococcus sp. CRU_1_1]
MNKRLIGITGGIATGKSTVSRYLANTYQLPILDADLYAREAVKIGSPILEAIFTRYGNRVRMPDNTLDRKQLGEIIFNQLNERRWLESQIHPYVRSCFETAIAQLEAKTIVLVIPLLFESNMTDLVTEIWLVYCSRDEQIKRLMERDRLTHEQAIARLESQLPIEKKAALANIVLDNYSTKEHLFHQIDQILNVTGD